VSGLLIGTLTVTLHLEDGMRRTGTISVSKMEDIRLSTVEVLPGRVAEAHARAQDYVADVVDHLCRTESGDGS